MFKLVEDYTYDWPVEVLTPCNGEYTKGQFIARFKLLSQDRIDALLMGTTNEDDPDLCREVLVGWSGVGNAEGSNEVVYSPEAKELMLKRPDVRIAITKAFFGSIAAKQDRPKN